MKRAVLVILFLIFSATLFAQQSKKLTVEDIFRSGKFYGKRLNSPCWLPDSNAFAFLKEDKRAKTVSIFKHNVSGGDENKWIDGAALLNPETKEVLHFSDYRILPSGKKILFKTDARRVWRRYDDGRFFVYDISEKKLMAVYDGERLVRHVKISPDENKAGYVLNGNIYYKNLKTGKTVAVTSDGNGTIINGMSDWVYEEEFGKGDRWNWSPDGKYIAFHRFDQAPIKTFSWTEFDKTDIVVKTVPYPKAGDPNSIVTIGVYNVEIGETEWMDIGAETDRYIPRIRWTKKPGTLLIERMNRLQNKLELLTADVDNGNTEIAFVERDSAWVSITDDIFFLKDGHRFIRTSESSGYNHIYIYDMDIPAKAQITNGAWEVTDVYGINENSGKIYFQANKGRMEERQLFSINMNGSHLQKLSSKAGTHSADFAPDFSVYLETFSNIKTPPQTALVQNNGKIIRTLIENKMENLKKYKLAYPEFTSFTTSDSVEIKAMITKPADFDPDKKYPVLIYGYSGPASQLVCNSWGRSTDKLWYTLLTQKGYIIFTLDQRGTGGRGKAFKNLAYGDIGKYMLIDHIEGVKYLRSLPYVDGDRIGIWGWSGGGYLTLMAMTKGSDYFKAGIAVAPVSDFRLYDNVWTERYMGLPSENKAGYDSTSVLSYTDQYKNGLLVIHGSSDDNVHLQNTMQFVEKLQTAGKPFEMMIYTGKNHSMLGKGSVYFHLYSLMTDFILRKL